MEDYFQYKDQRRVYDAREPRKPRERATNLQFGVFNDGIHCSFCIFFVSHKIYYIFCSIEKFNKIPRCNKI